MEPETELIRNNSSPKGDLKPAAIMRNIYSAFPALAMLAGMRLEVFTPLKNGSRDAKTLAGILGVQEDKLTPLLYSLVAAGLLKVEDEQFSNTEEAAKFLVGGGPDYLGGLSGFYKTLLEIGLKTAESIQSGKPQAKLDFHALPDEELMIYFRKQIHSSLNGGKKIAEKIDFSKFERLLDAGGGTGGVSIAVCNKYPHLKATVADLPKVAKLAELFIAEAGMSGRINVSTNDLCSDSPAGKYDVAILRALIQTLSKEDAQRSLKHIGQSMSSAGRIFIFGNVLENSRLGPPASLAFSLVFLNSYDDGKAYTEKEYHEMLAKAGFTDIKIEHEALSDGMSLVSAKKE